MHVIGEAFKRDANVEMTHVPLKGAAPLKQELLAGRLQVGGDQLSSSLADIKAGKLRALATNAFEAHPRAARRADGARAGLRPDSRSTAGTVSSRRRRRRAT